jgi:hypothetical protein
MSSPLDHGAKFRARARFGYPRLGAAKHGRHDPVGTHGGLKRATDDGPLSQHDWHRPHGYSKRRSLAFVVRSSTTTRARNHRWRGCSLQTSPESLQRVKLQRAFRRVKPDAAESRGDHSGKRRARSFATGALGIDSGRKTLGPIRGPNNSPFASSDACEPFGQDPCAGGRFHRSGAGSTNFQRA